MNPLLPTRHTVFRPAVLLLGVLLGACDDSVHKGQQVFEQNCKVCHAQGLNGAPIVGNAKMWGKRTPQGEPVLLQHAIEGYGLMPAKGGNSALADEEVAWALKYMLSQLPD